MILVPRLLAIQFLAAIFLLPAHAEENAVSQPESLEEQFAIQGGVVLTQAEIDAAFSKIPTQHRLLFIRDGERVNKLVGSLLRNKIVAAGITINGLPILSTNPSTGAVRRGGALDDYYLERVVGGPGAFVIAARNFRDFGRAIQQKLLKEIALYRPGALPSIPGERRPAKNGIRPTLPAGDLPTDKKLVPIK